MSVTVHPGRLRQELARRGWSAADLANHAGLSHPTISAALAGRPISARSLGLVAAALQDAPPVDAIDRLLFGEASL
jgi:lambda repressor-like predicted transcriptional regulator